MQNTNPYAGLSRKDLKGLLRLNKDDAAKKALLEAALTAQTQYVAGRLRDTEMSDTISALQAAVPFIEAAPEGGAREFALKSVRDSLTTLERFNVNNPPQPKRTRKSAEEAAPAAASVA